LREDADHLSKVVGVNRVPRAPLLQFLERPSRVFEDPTIDEQDVTVGREERDQTGDTVHGQSRIVRDLVGG